MVSGQKSLTTPPNNLKEAIDWLALVGGYGRSGLDISAYQKLSTALQALPGFNVTLNSIFSKVMSPDSFVKQVTENLGSGFLGYDGQNSETFNGSGIVASNGTYHSAYSGAGWIDNSASEYAKIFLVLALLVYYFITFLYWMCKSSGKWANKMTGHGALGEFFKTMGYRPWEEFKNGKSGSQIAKHLEGHYGFDELKKAYQGTSENSYETFLTKLEEDGPQKNINSPVTNCKIFAYAYLQSKQRGSEITDAIDALKKELESISRSSDASSTNDFSALKGAITTLLTKIQNFYPNPGSSGSGSASTWNPGSSEPGSDGPRKPGSSSTLSAVPVPTTLKEAIDWVFWLSGDDRQGGKGTITDLGAALFTQLKTISANGVRVVTFFQAEAGYGDDNNKKPITHLAKTLTGLIGCSGGKVNGNGIGASNRYECSYSNKYPLQSVDKEKAAEVFCSFIPLLFFGLSFLFWRCKSEWSKKKISDATLKKFMNQMGFIDHLNDSKIGSDIAGMFSAFKEFDAQGSKPTYTDFLKSVGLRAKPHLSSNGSSYPLYTLYYCSYYYLRHKEPNKIPATDNGIPTNAEDLEKTFQGLSEAASKFGVESAVNLSQPYIKLLTEIKTSLNEQPQQETPASEAVGAAANTAAASGAGSAGEHPASSQVQSSSGGAAAGSIFGVGAVGAGAAYSLDLFGIKGIIKNLLSFG
ncbi:variant erythrocyte surface antigen-1 family protein [Babesia caballi]|uniref:Variant erythrocyte surface antigen-1 family protein n=1 Tax=Babesia caballi TaxID=5871 RepID=A0AAV4LYW5_BABCB|nr:variant erythrocyte surface antigen-1 family protein [Babesia caballi]